MFSVGVKLVGGHSSAFAESWGVDWAEAEAVYDAGREAVVEVFGSSGVTASLERIGRRRAC
jgi:hypothetical protein